ncbi:unnamed protein product [Parnassius apollo]|uniref:(apollo) hypothetical protein n=1 Tax=Parnassius apollo TaxID=110799 RepID=A0A8S3WLN4_PARAO|nr:unnamed protein product [Parnassius apollo]
METNYASKEKNCSKRNKKINGVNYLKCNICNKLYEPDRTNVSFKRFNVMSKERKQKWRCINCVHEKQNSSTTISPMGTTNINRQEQETTEKSTDEHKYEKNVTIRSKKNLHETCTSSHMNTSWTSSDSEYDIKSLPDISTLFNFEPEIIKEELERTKSILASVNLEIENLLLENSSLNKKNMEYEKTISQLINTCNNLFYGSQKSVSSVQKKKNKRSSILSIESSKDIEQDMLITTKPKLLEGQTDSQLSFHKCPLDGTTETTESKHPVKQLKEQKIETQSTHTILEKKIYWVMNKGQELRLNYSWIEKLGVIITPKLCHL